MLRHWSCAKLRRGIVTFVTDDDADAPVRARAHEELKAGPLHISELAARLSDSGDLAHLDGLATDDLIGELDEILVMTDDTWMSKEGMVALVSVMLEGAVLTHRITQSELERGVIDVTPDLGAIDFGCFDGMQLAGGSTLKSEYPFDGQQHLDQHGSFVGVEGWLSSIRAGDVVGLRRYGLSIAIDTCGELGSGEAELSALREAFDARHVVGTGVEPEELLMDAICHDPTLFRTAVAPLGELLEAIGLEQRDAWFGLGGEDWDPPFVRAFAAARAKLGETWGFNPCCDQAFEIVEEAWSEQMFRRGGPAATDLRPVGRALAHGSVAPAFADSVLRDNDYSSDLLASFANELSNLPGKLAAPGLFLRALNYERDGDALLSEADLRASVLADPEYGPSLAELAWYESDRGDARRAVALLRRSGSSDDSHDVGEIEFLQDYIVPTPLNAGRNDPCPCGSGRKFKSCCQSDPKLTIEVRSSWLYHKILRYCLRPARRAEVEALFEITGTYATNEVLANFMPALVDIAMFEGGAVINFIRERGLLLPTDELALARSWVDPNLALWEIVDVDRGSSVTVRDTRTGETVVANEKTASRSLKIGDYLLTRILAAGSEHQIFGLPIGIELSLRASLLRLLDSSPGAEEIAEWLGMAFGSPTLLNREGEPTLMCRGVLRPKSTSWEELGVSLDKLFDRDDGDRWTEKIDIDGDIVVRGFLHRDGEDLVVESNSRLRFDRLLDKLEDALAGDLELLTEERVPISEVADRLRAEGSVAPLGAHGEMPPDMVAALQEHIREKEIEWCDESIPALGGLTPRQAADDPTRREDLLKLLNEFGDHDGSTGFVTFDAQRIRAELGIS
jgi:hypothetical protein